METFFSHVYFDENKKLNHKKEIATHLKETHDFMQENLPNIFLERLTRRGFREKDIDSLVKIIAYCHDFGKFTPCFQKYIKSNPSEKMQLSEREKKLKQHSLLSALFGLFIAKHYFNEPDKNGDFLKLISFSIIRLHHSDLRNVGDIDWLSDDEYANLKEQIISIDGQVYAYYQTLFPALNADLLRETFDDFCRDLRTGLILKVESSEIIQKFSGFDAYFMFNTVYSLLHDADVHSAGEVGHSSKEIGEYDLVKEYLKKLKSETQINKERTEIFETLNDKSYLIDLSKRLYKITAPTGCGKTLASFNFALQLKKRLKQENGINYKIIYVIPFTSIIDQTYKTFVEVFESAKIDTKCLLRHHYLSTGKRSSGIVKTEEKSNDEQLNSVVVESWGFDVIVTTFVQLFESLISNDKERIKKVHNIYNSIIIVDECQNIPSKYWLFFRDFFNQLTAFFDTYLVFLTATQPLIFDNTNDTPTELIEEFKKYFETKNRTNLIPIFSEQDLDEFTKFVIEKITNEKYNNILIVVNTVSDAQYLFKKMRDEEHPEGYEFIFLAASLVPKKKIENVDRLKKLNAEGKKYIAVSTQLIEAGVDIDNNVIFRDIAPIENLIQTAGRCNREGKRETENVFIVKLKNKGKNGLRSTTIYEPYLIEFSEKLLSNFSETGTMPIYERKYLKLFSEYMVEKSRGVNNSTSIKSSISELNYTSNERGTESISSFKVLQGQEGKITCFINLNEESKSLLDKHKEIMRIQDVKLKFDKWAEYKNEFQMYILDVPIRIVKSLIKTDPPPSLLIIENDEWKNYYDETIGYNEDTLWV